MPRPKLAADWREKVELNHFQPLRQTIKEKAAGGEIVHLMREDDTNGKWNYEGRCKNERERMEIRSIQMENS
jgi:hypothetical protein